MQFLQQRRRMKREGKEWNNGWNKEKERKEENCTVHRHILTSTSVPSLEEQSQVHQ
jgi:hypothetical protein